ncbi:PTPLA-domain-containing protein [Suillus clintonianus]|uniref:PTPLA-domain-containing protein n=1 Tax=Suillus clintonianus TaxID=1904413 RepID=UPI001B87F52C|nr:PTPLA-domain-containing protein [Suillus clintonianus]KAG2150907.1 PTPLA-domain-containing protein [Suillus clintonianus]
MSSARSRASGPSLPVRSYLIAFNALSAAGWAYVIYLTLAVFRGQHAPISAYDFFKPLASYVPTSIIEFLIPQPTTTNRFSTTLAYLIRPYFPATYDSTFFALAPVQSLAALEILHVLFGLVRSPLPTTVIQVSSRLILVWGIVERFPHTHSSPIYTTMILAWALTEVPRYAYYALSLAGCGVPGWLTWIRYSTFYVLYPVGAGSEALVMLSTIPEWSGGKWAVWTLEDWVKAGLVAIWVPGLWVMYSHMMRMRRKVLGSGKGQKLGAKPKDRIKAE